ncbi:RadC family protein [Neobacillus mesonae]|uniref:JAB domain-containing protein n=1 Tax=Neobacillus mesonae TaxID=1193713 RepID=UPI002559C57E|nr:DNA repair protein RadC [Neobacillus mesonae]
MPKGKNNSLWGNYSLRKARKMKKQKERELGKMEFMSIFEVVRIKQEIKESQEPFVQYSIRSPEDAQQLAASYIADEDREVLLVLMLNTKNQVVGLHRAHVGSLNSSIVHPREVMKCAILNNAASIIISHQHPSGDPTPSREDIEVTKRLAEAGKVLGIEVLDHIIVTHTGKHVSLKEKGYL